MSVLSALSKIGEWEAPAGSDGDLVSTFGPATASGTDRGVLKTNQLNGYSAVRFVHNSTIYECTDAAFKAALATWGGTSNAALTTGCTLIRVVKPATVADYNWLLFYDGNSQGAMRMWLMLDSRDASVDRFAVDFTDQAQQGYRGSSATADNFTTPTDVLYVVMQVKPYVANTSVVRISFRIGNSTTTTTTTIGNNGALASSFLTGNGGRNFFLYGFGGDDFYGALAPACVSDSDASQILVDLQAKFAAAADSTAPTLSAATNTQSSYSTAVIGATTNEGNGTLYGVLTTTSTPPTATQVKAGQNAAGTSAVFAGSVAVSSTGTKTISATGLTAGTTYYAHLMHEDAGGNKSAVLTSTFTLQAQITPGRWLTHPYQTIASTLRIGVEAEQQSGGESVTFRINGGSPITVSSRSYNADTCAFDFNTLVTASDYADGPITLDATVHSVGAADRALPTLTINANSGGTLTERLIYVDGTNGNDSTGDGTSAHPYATIRQARRGAYVAGGSSPTALDGAVAVVRAGNYVWQSSHHDYEPNGNTYRPFTVRAAPGVSRASVQITSLAANETNSQTEGLCTSIIQLENITLKLPIIDMRNGTLILKNVAQSGTGRVSDFTYAGFSDVFALDVTTTDAKRAFESLTLALRCRTYRTGESPYHNCKGVFLCGSYDLDPLTFSGTYHPDLLQITTDTTNAIWKSIVSRHNSETDVRIQGSTSDISIAQFDSDCTGTFSFELERAYINLLVRNYRTTANLGYNDARFDDSSNVVFENLSTPTQLGAHANVTFRTVATPKITITPAGGTAVDAFATSAIGTAASGTAITKNFTLANPGSATLRIGDVQVLDATTGLPATDWDISTSPASTIAASGSSTFTLRLKSTAAVGDHTTRVVIYNDAIGFSEFTATATVGAAAPEVPEGPDVVTFDFKFRINGVLTDATSVIMRSADGTYGAKRTDTDAIVVAANQTMTPFSTGVYRWSIKPDERGLTYAWVAEVLYQGATYHFPFVLMDGEEDADGSNVIGRYASYEGVRRVLGELNLKVYSQLQNDSTDFDYTTIQADIDDADDFTDLRASRGTYYQYAGPFTDSVQFFNMIQKASNYQAAALLVEHRSGPLQGLADEDFFRVMNGLFRAAEKVYAMLFDSDRQLDGTTSINGKPKPGTFQSVALTFDADCACDEFGCANG